MMDIAYLALTAVLLAALLGPRSPLRPGLRETDHACPLRHRWVVSLALLVYLFVALLEAGDVLVSLAGLRADRPLLRASSSSR